MNSCQGRVVLEGVVLDLGDGIRNIDGLQRGAGAERAVADECDVFAEMNVGELIAAAERVAVDRRDALGKAERGELTSRKSSSANCCNTLGNVRFGELCAAVEALSAYLGNSLWDFHARNARAEERHNADGFYVFSKVCLNEIHAVHKRSRTDRFESIGEGYAAQLTAPGEGSVADFSELLRYIYITEQLAVAESLLAYARYTVGQLDFFQLAA